MDAESRTKTLKQLKEAGSQDLDVSGTLTRSTVTTAILLIIVGNFMMWNMCVCVSTAYIGVGDV